VRGFVFDAGAFIALERRAPLLLGILDEALRGTVQIVLPRTVIAQVWRGGPRWPPPSEATPSSPQTMPTSPQSA
jgi:hypothetical protein